MDSKDNTTNTTNTYENLATTVDTENHTEAEIKEEIKASPTEEKTVQNYEDMTREPWVNPRAAEDEKKKKKKTYIIIGSVIALVVLLGGIMIGGFVINMMQPKPVSIQASYQGSKEAGVKLDEHNDGFIVVAKYEDGTKEKIKHWRIQEDTVLQEDKSSTVIIGYKDCTSKVTVVCSTSAVTGIEARYNGDKSAGTVIDDSSDFTVKEKHKNGTTTDCEGNWTVDATTLKADETAKVKVNYNEFSTEVSIECSTQTLTGIEASYDGDTEAGTKLNANNKGIKVKAIYKNGKKKTVTDYKIKEDVTLIAGQTSDITIQYEDFTYDLSVECSTIDPEVFKAECETIAYTDLARNPDAYIGRKVVFTGKVVQVMEQGNVGALRVNVTKGSWGIYNDTVYVLYTVDSSNRVLEDDIVSFYGFSTGLYTYESVMGASITIPQVLAEIVELR